MSTNLTIHFRADAHPHSLTCPAGAGAYWAQVIINRVAGVFMVVSEDPAPAPATPYLGQVAQPDNDLARAFLLRCRSVAI